MESTIHTAQIDYAQHAKDCNTFNRHPRIIAARKQYRADCKIMLEREAWDIFQTVINEVKTDITGLV